MRKGDVVLIQNGSGADVDRFGVLALGAPLILPSDDLENFQEHITFAGDAPSSSPGNFAVLLEPLASDEIGRAAVNGIVTVKVDAGDGSADFCDVADGVTDSLAMNARGSTRVLWRASGTGKQWAVVRLGGGGGGLDLWNATAVAVAGAKTLAIATAAADVLQFTGGVPAGAPTPGTGLAIKPGAPRQTLQTGAGGTVLWEFPRFYE